MSGYQITTPALKTSSDALLNVISGLQDGTMDRDDAKALTRAASAMPAQVSADLKTRLAAPRLAKIDAQAASRAA